MIRKLAVNVYLLCLTAAFGFAAWWVIWRSPIWVKVFAALGAIVVFIAYAACRLGGLDDERAGRDK